MLGPTPYVIRRSLDIRASASTIQSIISDLRRFSEWSPWDHLDPSMKKTFRGEPGKVGSAHEWEGNKKAGAGRMTIQSTDPGREVVMEIEFFKPFEDKTTGRWTIEDAGGGTCRVTWAMEGERKGFVKVLSLVVNFDKMIGRDFERGLARLKAIAER